MRPRNSLQLRCLSLLQVGNQLLGRSPPLSLVVYLLLARDLSVMSRWLSPSMFRQVAAVVLGKIISLACTGLPATVVVMVEPVLEIVTGVVNAV